MPIILERIDFQKGGVQDPPAARDLIIRNLLFLSVSMSSNHDQENATSFSGSIRRGKAAPFPFFILTISFSLRILTFH
jgi:hypothetical protein